MLYYFLIKRNLHGKLGLEYIYSFSSEDILFFYVDILLNNKFKINFFKPYSFIVH